MPQGLRRFIGIVDSAMVVYWAVSLAACLGLINLPAASMYAGYGTAHTDAWNWSFAPLDLTFALVGFVALYKARGRSPAWRGYAILSLALTMCAGGMAVAYWALLMEFDASWWLPNLVLLLFPLIWLPRLLEHAPARIA